MNWCKYDPIESLKNSSLIEPRKIICITTGEIFNSMKEGTKKYNAANISYCCLGKRKYAGKLPDGTKLVWMYYEDYLKQNIK